MTENYAVRCTLLIGGRFGREERYGGCDYGGNGWVCLHGRVIRNWIIIYGIEK